MVATLARPALASVVLLALAAPSRMAAAASEIPWSHDPTVALTQAVESARPVLVDVWAVWCVPCKKMDETTYRDPNVIAAIQSFVPLKIDHDAQETFVERHSVEALPAVLFLDGRGREIARLSGLVDAPALVARMERIRAGYSAYLVDREKGADPGATDRVAQYFRNAGNPRAAVDLLRQRLRDKQPIAAEPREAMQLHLALAQLAIGETKAGTAALDALANDAALPRHRGEALAGLVRAYQARGARPEADAALTRLRGEFPEIAAEEFPGD